MKVWYRHTIGDAHTHRVSVLDHGLLYGDGVFEGIRITARRIVRLSDHLARFAVSARAISLELPYTLDAIAAAVIQTARANDTDEAYVRLLATRGVGELGVDPNSCREPELFCIVGSLKMFPPELRDRGLRLLTSAWRRPPLDALDPQVKSLNYLNNVLVKRDARLKGYDDGLILNAQGRVTEASGANVFAVIDGVLVTPPTADGALPGITRDTLLRCQRAQGMAEVRSLSRYDLLCAEEVFLAGSGAGIVNVASLDDTAIGAGTRHTTDALAKAYREYVYARGTAF